MHLKKIKNEVEKIFGIEDISNPTRQYRYVIARQTYYYLASKLTSLSMYQAGKFLGKHHASVVNAKKKLEPNLKYDPRFRTLFRMSCHRFGAKNDFKELTRDSIHPLAEGNYDVSEDHKKVISMLLDIPEEHMIGIAERLKPIIKMYSKSLQD